MGHGCTPRIAWYQAILKEGLETGLEQGIQQGRQQGSRREAIVLVSRMLTRRVGVDASAWRERLEALTLEELEVLAEDLLVFFHGR